MSETFVLPVGPQHPALKEPTSFRFKVDGEYIVDADLRLGYNHRGMEKGCEARTYVQDIYLLERVCGICSNAHMTCFAQGVERLMGIEPPPRGVFIRCLMGELERIHSHLLWLGVAGHEIGFDTFFMYTWRDREVVMDLLEMVSGNRVNYGMQTFGGVRRDLDGMQIKTLLEGIAALKARTPYYLNLGATEPTMVARIAGVGKLPREKAIELTAAGPTTRASGVDFDVRKDDPYAGFGDLIPFTIVTDNGCDVLARVVVRAKEMMASYDIMEFILRNLPAGEVRTKAPRKVPEGETVSRVEAQRGELIHYIRANGTDKPDRVKVRAPTLANWPSTLYMLRGAYLADIPIIMAAIDPCLSCTDRMAVISDVRGGEKVWDWETLRQYGIEFHRRRGIRP
ncbi:MAG: nickel-dependent hydrogenase large subunit [Candidatus Edwardsbacteria bacterium]|jgi:NADH-quinone oxidoreductase subunit D|nr:nickel-dependent hydrogenase large subunit [Candidatus Edwardsbacteria bacterium]